MIDVVAAHGVTYRINNPGGLIGRPLSTGVPYEARLLEAIYAEGFTGTALDIGAHVGNHTLWLAVVCGLQVHAFEPLHHERLRENVALNHLESTVTVHAHALGDEEGAVAVVGKDQLGPATEGSVLVVPLDHLVLPDDISVIKMDVEDMEPFVLRGGEVTIRTNRPVIYTETRDAHAVANVAEVLEPWGYCYTATIPTATPVTRWESS